MDFGAHGRAHIAVVTLITLVIAGFGGAAWAQIPDTSAHRPSTVYYADGVTELGTFHRWDADPINLEDLPTDVIETVVATTDPDFHTRSVGVVTILKAAADIVRGREFTVEDPLAEAFVRQFSPAERGTIERVRELARVMTQETTYSRSELLERHLNTAYFGRGAYGIEKAAQAYFGVSAAQLTPSQAESLAAALTQPGAIAKADDPLVLPLQRIDGWDGDTGYLMDMVRDELATHGISAHELETDGLTIVTTFDAHMQRAAVDAVASLPEDKSPETKVTLVSVDPSTGGIRALYGSEDYSITTRNRPLLDRAQGGSTFKPFALIAALEEGLTLGSLFPSTTPIDVDGYVVTNVDHEDHGVVDLEYATANSVNAVYAQVNALVGPENTREVAIRAGLPESTPGLDADPSNVFGTASPRPVDMATVFATYAAGGERHERFVVTSVHDRSGRLVHEGGKSGEQVFEPKVIADATHAMTGVINYGTGVEARLDGRAAAGKTGTSDGNKSAWFCGFIPQLATVVTMYQIGEDGSEESITPFGGSVAVMGGSHPARVWHSYMSVATAGMDVLPLPTTHQDVTE